MDTERSNIEFKTIIQWKGPIMKELIGTARNIHYVIDSDRAVPVVELIIMATQAQYKIHDGKFEQVRPIETIRINIQQAGLKVLIADLLEIDTELSVIKEVENELKEKIAAVKKRLKEAEEKK